jgi:mannosyltransferase OCH1-like enzyme
MINKKDYIDLHRKYSYSFNHENMLKNEDWKKIIAGYNNFDLSEETIIPKKIHQIWLGSELPERYKRLTDSWLKYNPDWEYKLWTDSDILDLDLLNKDIFNSMSNLGMKADLLRIEILNKFGGLYVDIDFECLKSFDDMHRLSFYTGIVYGHNVEINVGLIGSIPNHPILIDYLSNVDYKVGMESVDAIFNTTGPYYFTKIFLRNVTNETKDIVAFPTIYFYPFHNTYYPEKRLFGFEENDLNIINKFLTEDSYATHWWHVSWNK